MSNETGFSLTEVLVALFILSLGAVILSQSVGSMVGIWDRTQDAIQTVNRLGALNESINPAERSLKSQEGVPDGPALSIDDGPPLQLSSPRLDRGADCQFDMVGRRCR